MSSESAVLRVFIKTQRLMAPLLVSQSLAARHGGIQEELVSSLTAQGCITATHGGAKGKEEEGSSRMEQEWRRKVGLRGGISKKSCRRNGVG